MLAHQNQIVSFPLSCEIHLMKIHLVVICTVLWNMYETYPICRRQHAVCCTRYYAINRIVNLIQQIMRSALTNQVNLFWIKQASRALTNNIMLRHEWHLAWIIIVVVVVVAAVVVSTLANDFFDLTHRMRFECALAIGPRVHHDFVSSHSTVCNSIHNFCSAKHKQRRLLSSRSRREFFTRIFNY